MKILHLCNNAVLGRYKISWIQEEFAKHGIEYIHNISSVPKGWRTPELLIPWIKENNVEWMFWGWEKHSVDIYENYWKQHPCKILIYGQEQPQALIDLRKAKPYCDICITSSPVYRNEVHGFWPFGIHTRYIRNNGQKQNRILMSGSYRHSRGQLMEWVLKHQPFEYPVYIYTPPLEHNTVEHDETRILASRYPKFFYPAAKTREDYIYDLMYHLSTHRIFLDFTTNSTNKDKFHTDLDDLFNKGRTLPGGYCPERVLDALYQDCRVVCFWDKALEQVLGSIPYYYCSYDELRNSMKKAIHDSTNYKSSVEKYTTENVIRVISETFKTNKVIEL